jgi:phage pi2 protein 07
LENEKTYNLKRCLKATKNYTLYKGPEEPLEMSGYAMYITNAPESREDTIIKLKFADSNFNPSYFTSTDIDQKLEVQMEKTIEGATRCYGLEERKGIIGGCWVNYTAGDFAKYRSDMKEKFVNRNPACDNIY